MFTVIVPSYNRADLILKTIKSVLDQTYTNFELIVVDDGSTDHTIEILQSVSDARFSFYRKENSERGATRNQGIRLAKGQYITFIDSDDLYYPNALQNAYDRLVGLAMPACYAQAFEVIDVYTGKQMQAATVVTTETINQQLIKGNFLGCIGVFVQNELLQQHQFEEDRMFAGTEDWLLWLQLAARYPFYYSNEVCAAMIEHEHRSVLSFSEEKLNYRSSHLKQCLLLDPATHDFYGERLVNDMYAHMLSYTSLHLAISKKPARALHYLVKAAKVNFRELLTRRTLGIIKTVCKNFFA